jgi:hypothetical protein
MYKKAKAFNAEFDKDETQSAQRRAKSIAAL